MKTPPISIVLFLLAALIAWYAHGTPIKPVNTSGMALLAGGMYLLGR